jgi:hypothetical protein
MLHCMGKRIVLPELENVGVSVPAPAVSCLAHNSVGASSFVPFLASQECLSLLCLCKRKIDYATLSWTIPV